MVCILQSVFSNNYSSSYSIQPIFSVGEGKLKGRKQGEQSYVIKTIVFRSSRYDRKHSSETATE